MASRLSKYVGLRVQYYRKSLGYSQETLAAKADISATFLSHIENGKNNASLEILEKVAEALGASVVDLFPRSERKSKSALLAEVKNAIKDMNEDQLERLLLALKGF